LPAKPRKLGKLVQIRQNDRQINVAGIGIAGCHRPAQDHFLDRGQLFRFIGKLLCRLSKPNIVIHTSFIPFTKIPNGKARFNKLYRFHNQRNRQLRPSNK
jgi:hypothetical protein